jgi:hypothetical protein
MTIKWLLSWTPFKIDAMGLVTVLGAEEVNRAVGRLCSSRITEFLPTVGSFVVVNDSIRYPIPGFILYNITDGICATDVTGWFSRWMLFQCLTYNSTTLTIDVLNSFNSPRNDMFLPAFIGMATIFTLIFIPALMTDCWGLANSISLGISVLIRFAILKENRDAIDRSAESSLLQSTTIVKTFWKLPTGSSVIIYMSRGVLTECLLSTPKPSNYRKYNLLRYVGWTAFVIHIVSLSMTSLPNQLLSVSVLAVSTICVATGVASNDELIGSRIRIRRNDNFGSGTSMASLFARLRLSSDEEDSMVAWGLMPLPRNEIWWRKYRDCMAQNTLVAFNTWKERQTWTRYENEDHQIPTEDSSPGGAIM